MNTFCRFQFSFQGKRIYSLKDYANLFSKFKILSPRTKRKVLSEAEIENLSNLRISFKLLRII